MPFQSQMPELYRWIESLYGTGYSYNQNVLRPSDIRASGGGSPWVGVPRASSASGGSPWEGAHAGSIIGEPTVQIPRDPRGIRYPDNPRRGGARGRIDPFGGGDVHPGGDTSAGGNAFNPDPGPGVLHPGGQPIVETPRQTGGGAPPRANGSASYGGLGRLANIPFASAQGSPYASPPVGQGHIYIGNEYRPNITGEPLPPTGQIQIDPATGQPFNLSDWGPEATGPETTSTPTDETGAGVNVRPPTYHDPTNPNDPVTARNALNMRIAMATAPGTPNFGGARRPQSDEGVNVTYPRQSGFNLRRDEEGGFYRTRLNNAPSNPRLRAWAELLTTGEGRARAAAMTRTQQQAYAGVAGAGGG